MSRQRHWCWTWNNYPEDLPTQETLPDTKYLIYGKEVGESGTPHLQGYVEFTKPKRLAWLKRRLPKVHWEARKGTRDQARDYCMKDGDFHEFGPWGTSQGKRSDLEEVKTAIEDGATETDIAESHFGVWCKYPNAVRSYIRMRQKPRDFKTEVHVCWGDTGTGKSYVTSQLTHKPYKLTNSKWWDGYDGVSDVIIDEFSGWLPVGVFLQLTDRSDYKVEVKGGMVNFAPKRIFITSHDNPEDWYPLDRWPEIERRITTLKHFSNAGAHGTEVRVILDRTSDEPDEPPKLVIVGGDGSRTLWRFENGTEVFEPESHVDGGVPPPGPQAFL